MTWVSLFVLSALLWITKEWPSFEALDMRRFGLFLALLLLGALGWALQYGCPT